jgi:myosin heavy subunit
MTALFHIHEPGILHNLRERAKQEKPYTFIGTVLISVNPLRTVVEPPMDAFINRPLDPEHPHPYAIAEVRTAALCTLVFYRNMYSTLAVPYRLYCC